MIKASYVLISSAVMLEAFLAGYFHQMYQLETMAKQQCYQLYCARSDASETLCFNLKIGNI